MAGDQTILSELARVKALFQQRAIVAALGLTPSQRALQDAAHGRPGGASSLVAAAGAYPPAEDRCRSCREMLCGYPDAAFAGVVPPLCAPIAHEEASA